MSISPQQAVQQLKVCLINILPDRYRPNSLSKKLSKDLESCSFPKTPGKFEDACVFFREFFLEISHPNILSRGPILFANILFAIKNFGSRLKAFRSILLKTCKEHFHYEALFAVMCEALHKPVGYYERFNSQNGRDFLLKGMIMVRIEQRRQFPPGPNCNLTYLFHFSLDEIILMMKRKNGMRGHEETRSYMERSLRMYNSYWNEKYSSPIRRILQSNPNFFSNFKSKLENLYWNITLEKTREIIWLTLMIIKINDFYQALDKAGIFDKSKIWIVYWYMRYRYDHSSEPKQGQESFNDLMTRIVQPGQMAFPFRDPPRLFKKNGQIFRAALRWESVPTSDLLEICYRWHINSRYGPVPSQCILAASIRRKLCEVKITKAAVKIQKMARRSLWHFYLKRFIAALIIKKRVLRVVTPILHVKHAKFLIASAIKRIFIQKKFFKILKCHRYIQQIKAGCVIFNFLNRQNHVREYQKIRAASIIQSRLIALFERQRLDTKIKEFTAASTLSRFAKVKQAAIILKRIKRFVKDLSCYDCPLCFEELSSVSIGIRVIQPCGHIHCKDCFDKIGTKCSCCRAKSSPSDCKSVGIFLSQSNPKFFFTRENSEKKAAIDLIGAAMKRHLIAQN